jgi:hypothetical protein
MSRVPSEYGERSVADLTELISPDQISVSSEFQGATHLAFVSKLLLALRTRSALKNGFDIASRTIRI